MSSTIPRGSGGGLTASALRLVAYALMAVMVLSVALVGVEGLV